MIGSRGVCALRAVRNVTFIREHVAHVYQASIRTYVTTKPMPPAANLKKRKAFLEERVAKKGETNKGDKINK